MGKNQRCGQAQILEPKDLEKIRRAFKSKTHRLIFDIARWTGERWGAILKLQVTDVYQNAVLSLPREEITFPARTRKADPLGRRATRQVPIHPQLKEILLNYNPPLTGWLFPSESGHLSWSAADKAFRSAVDRAGLGGRGISTHSTRRTFITALARTGLDIRTLQAITGHKEVKTLLRYVEADPELIKRAIALL